MYSYRRDVLEHLLRHGIRPTGNTNPQLVRDYVRDLYKYKSAGCATATSVANFPSASTPSEWTPCAAPIPCSPCTLPSFSNRRLQHEG